MELKENLSYFNVPANIRPIVKTSRIILKEYDPTNSSWDKVKYILGVENRALSAKEIIRWIYQLEPDLNHKPEERKKTIENNVYAILSTYTKEGRVIRFKAKSKKGYKYGFSIWFNKEGTIKNEYLV